MIILHIVISIVLIFWVFDSIAFYINGLPSKNKLIDILHLLPALVIIRVWLILWWITNTLIKIAQGKNPF